MSTNENADTSSAVKMDTPVFKKPLLIGKVGKFPKKVVKECSEQNVEIPVEISKPVEEVTKSSEEDKEIEILHKSEEVIEEKQITLPYKEPVWSGMPVLLDKKYKLEVLKSGSIIETIDLMEKKFWVFGRLTCCDICMAHPTISRYHAVLQYRNIESDDQPKGFYLFDLSSTHGTYLNKNKLKPRIYVKVYVGHLLKLGLSSRSYLLTGPQSDTEEESELSVTELKKKRQEELARREEAEKEAIRKREEEKEEMQKKLEERGVDWGLGEDADEETDISENPFAQTNNEELYLDDPKKALRGFMEREGHDFEYDCTEQGMGQFLCKVELPLDDDRGRPIVAEVLHKGKKKEAVVQCALEACRILDRYGLLRQATHESRKRKAKNWEENDFYDSDEDTFLDRTGTIEKKRENRMKAKVPTQPETYQSLLEKEATLRKEIHTLEKQLAASNKNTSTTEKSKSDEDSLDNYMKELKQMKLDKQTVSKLKTDLNKLKQDLANVIKLANIAKPTNLPTLIKGNPANSSNTNTTKHKLPIFGKRLKVKVQLPARKDNMKMNVDDNDDEEEDIKDGPDIKGSNENEICNISNVNVEVEQETVTPDTAITRKRNVTDSDDKGLAEYTKIDASFKMILPLMSCESEQYVKNIWSKLKSLHPEYSKTIQEDIINLFAEYIDSCKFIAVIESFTKEIDLITAKLKAIGTNREIIDVAHKLIGLVKEITLMENRLDQDDKVAESNSEETSELDLEKRKKKNQRRMQQRQERAELEKRKGYEEDASKEDYNMWVPPVGQTGDGRTNLNEKYGY